MKIAALQMVSTPDVARNLDSAGRLVALAADAGARLAALPEYFCLMGQRDDDKLAIAESDGDGPIQNFLAETARRHGLWLIGGTLPIKAEKTGPQGRAAPAPPDGQTVDGPASAPPERVRNACCVYGPDGARVARYDKIHLFAFDNGRGERYDEGRVLEAGSEPVAFDADGLRVGLSICYDLRFPELYRRLMTPAACDLLVVPAAFTHTTGQAHWELLLRARAVENQCHVLASAQGGLHENGRRTWGHSMVVDPWGELLAVQAEGEGIALADATLQRRNAVREQLPALAHRRL